MQEHRFSHASSDLQSFKVVVGRVLKPFALRHDGGHARRAHLLNRRSARLQLAEISWNNRVTLDAGRLEGFHLVQLPLAGSFRDLGSGRCFRRGEAQFVPARSRVALQIEADCRLLVLRVECALLSPRSDALDLSSDGGARFLRALHYLGEELDAEDESPGGARSLRRLEDLLLQNLDVSLGEQTQCMSGIGSVEGRPAGRAGPVPTLAAPWYVLRAKQFIGAHLDQDFDLADIAAVAGVSPRTLQNGFRSSIGLSPLAYRASLRIARVREELRDADPGTTSVTEVALKWGFTELGRFARRYRERFGENPADTLRRPCCAGRE